MKIVALCGLLGYGYNTESLDKAFEEKVDYVGVDAGSTDPGPYYLGSGQSFTDRGAVKRDLSYALPKALSHKAPFIIGTAGGSGSKVHTDWLCDIIREIAKEKNLSFKMGIVYSDVDTDYVLNKFESGKIINMSDEFGLTREQILNSERIVSQIGVQPIIDLLKEEIDVIVCGRACDTAIYAAPCIMAGYDHGLAFHMAKIMECGAMCSEPVAAADVMQGYIYDDCFELCPANPERRCTVSRVAAHTMYEQTNPYMIYEPDGEINLKDTTYEQVDERRVRIKGSKFTPAVNKTLKLEGVSCVGYRTVCMGAIYDSLTIKNIDLIKNTVAAFVKENSGLSDSDYTLKFRSYGDANSDMCIMIDVVGKTQEIADTVCSLARSRMLHCDYEGRKSTAGNLAFPFSPSDIHVGKVYEFSVFHLAKVDSLSETVKIVKEEVGK